ncbi:MAG: ThiF family adenylyltransferase [Bacilli bacterium]|jgi:tRNA A37 threonylcarbamoyladenosine dehydratase
MNKDKRSISLIGEEKFAKLTSKKILVIGIGGVGGMVLEALVRSGFRYLFAIDRDVVDESNINRQILFTSKDIGDKKTEIAKKRINEIDDDIEFKGYFCDIKDSMQIIRDIKPDFVVDAIDDIDAKVMLISFLLENSLPFISSMGMGNRLNPSKVNVTTLDKTHDDPLAKKLRGLMNKTNFSLKMIPVVFSTEIPVRRSLPPASMMMVPSSAGIAIVYHIISSFLN